jgi:hypothetical protein
VLDVLEPPPLVPLGLGAVTTELVVAELVVARTITI